MLCALCILLALCGCEAVLQQVRPVLEHEGEVYLYLQPFPQEAEDVARRLAARGGIGVRSGCHCALDLTVKRLANIPPWAEQFQRLILTVFRRFELPGVVRVSLGIENTESDVDALVTAMDGIARRPKAGPAEKAFRQRMDDVCKAAGERVYGDQAGLHVE